MNNYNGVYIIFKTKYYIEMFFENINKIDFETIKAKNAKINFENYTKEQLVSDIKRLIEVRTCCDFNYVYPKIFWDFINWNNKECLYFVFEECLKSLPSNAYRFSKIKDFSITTKGKLLSSYGEDFCRDNLVELQVSLNEEKSERLKSLNGDPKELYAKYY